MRLVDSTPERANTGTAEDLSSIILASVSIDATQMSMYD